MPGYDLRQMVDHSDIFNCPQCEGGLIINSGRSVVQCKECDNEYGIEGNIPRFFIFSDVYDPRKDITRKVKAFYEETPFPNYEEFETAGDLIHKAEQGIFARLLNEQIPFNARVLEVGCGTGQLTNYLGLAQRFLFGVDMCVNSLKLAQSFKEKHNIERVGFYQMNLFKPIFKKESFHFVICNGVLHHTSDPYIGFQSIAKLVKRGGYIIIGLYNKYGRLVTDARRIILFNIFNDRFMFLDPYLRKGIGEAKKEAWFKDQYKNPHESKHTIEEVLTWFNKTGFDFMYGIPNPVAFENFSPEDSMFTPHPPGTWFDHMIIQAQLMVNGSREGGFFIMIGRKKAS